MTGSSKGLGLALSEKFLELGDSVVLAARSEAAVQSAVERLQQKFPGQTVRGLACDVGRIGEPLTCSSHRQVQVACDKVPCLACSSKLDLACD